MKKFDVMKFLNIFGGPVLMGLLGLILLFNPDSAPTLIAKIAGWVLLIACGLTALSLFTGGVRGGRLLMAIAGALVGLWLLCNPLVLASALGRFAGILLLYRGGRDLWEYRDYSGSGKAPIVGIAAAVIGAVLFFLPLSASRLLFSAVGLVLIAVAIGEIYDRLKIRRLLEAGDPNIIDALE